jgi:uncharacterized protein YqiB (DUF1249 family)
MGESRMRVIDKENVRGYKDALLRCKCGSEWLRKFDVNNFRNTPIDLNNGQKEINIEDRVSLLECIACGHITLPVTSYNYLQGNDKHIAERLQELLNKRNKKT